jgi:hypothetical protein
MTTKARCTDTHLRRHPRQALGVLLGDQAESLHDLDRRALEIERVKVQALDARVEQLPTHRHAELDAVRLDLLVVVLYKSKAGETEKSRKKKVREREE